ncbi:MAG: chemotaxis protein CheW [Mariniphaga sp.]
MDQIVTFSLDHRLYALPLNSVVRVIHAVYISSLPKAPAIICGIVNVKGQIIPVVDIRKRFGFATREIDRDDQLIIANTGKRTIALIVDEVNEILAVEAKQQVNTADCMPFAGYIGGIAKIQDEMVLIYDLEQFLNIDEEKELEMALTNKTK